ncbi:MAG: GTPase domain-containing protein, partial [Planctomycetota bacterium]
MKTVTLSLISHTNNGKTTLARTLLRKDIGEVLDQAHVTEVSEAHPLLETGGERLLLWDTPGFGDTVRLMKRLRSQSNPIGWFLHQVWDRIADRPLWCSQEAVRNIQEEADVVLYLVNASEDPQDAGYVNHELELLTWIDVPVLLLLNMTGSGAIGESLGSSLEQTWRSHVASWPIIKGVLTLDAFSRCWVEEGVLLEQVGEILPDVEKPAMQRLVAAWNQRNQQIYQDSVGRLAAYMSKAACDQQPLEGTHLFKGVKDRAMGSLGERLEESTRELMRHLIADHGLDGKSMV